MSGPIRVDWVNFETVPGLRGATGWLGMTFLPGKWGHGRAGDHRRDLEADATTLRDAHHVDALLVLVEDHELVSARVPTIADVMTTHGIELLRHPIPDGGVPADTAAFSAVVEDLIERVRAGQRVVVACMGRPRPHWYDGRVRA